MIEELEMKRSSDKLVEQVIRDFNAHRIEVSEHMFEFKRHTDDEEKKWLKIITLVEKNEWSINELREAVETHRAQTEELILLNTRLKSVKWFGSGLSALVGWGLAAVLGLSQAYNWLIGK